MERLLGLEIPEKAQWLRVLLAELTRLNSHLIWLGTHAMDIGALTVFLYTFREREEILRIFEGLVRPADDDQLHPHRRACDGAAAGFFCPRAGIHQELSGKDRRIRESADRQSDLQESLAGCGHLIGNGCNCTGRDGAEYARLGGGLRSAPRYALLRLREVSVQGAGLARTATAGRGIWSGLQEMRESVGIIQQALDGMPEGAIKADAPKIVLPDREKMKTQMEALIHHFKIVTEGFAVPAGEVYQGIESPRGQMGYYVVSDGTAKPYRVHLRNPSFATLQALETMCKGRMLADVVAVVGSIDIVLGEIDR